MAARKEYTGKAQAFLVFCGDDEVSYPGKIVWENTPQKAIAAYAVRHQEDNGDLPLESDSYHLRPILDGEYLEVSNTRASFKLSTPEWS